MRTGEDFAEKFATDALGRNEIVANVEPKVLEHGAIELFRKAKADFEEGGSNTLFLALGMLRWSVPGDLKRSYRAPLIMLPVRLERQSAASKPYLKGHDDEPVFNLTLLQMLRQDFQIEIPGLATELPTDTHGVNVRLVWKMVRDRIAGVPGMEVVEEVVLSTFSFAKYLMWKDLADRTETLKASAFVRHVIDTPRDPYEGGGRFVDPRTIDQIVDPSKIMAPLSADSSQIVAIHASGSDGDFVLEGPPGTGKSETIGNIIAHNLGLGHRVLFVSEKMAALDVVYRRLSACGLGDFCLELHSTKANKRAVLDQLGSACENRRGHPIDEWQKKATRLGETRDRLNRLVEALHRVGPGGLSARDAIARSVRYRDVHRFRLDWDRDMSRLATSDVLGRLEDLANRLGQQFSQLQPEDLRDFEGIARSEWSYAWLAQVVAEATSLRVAIENLISRRAAFAERLALRDAGSDLDESGAIAKIAVLVPDCAALELRFALESDGRETMETLEKLLRQLQDYRTLRETIAANYPDELIASAPLQAWLSERVKSETKMWPLKTLARRRLRKSIWASLQMDASRASAPELDLESMIKLADQRSAIIALAKTQPRNTPWRGFETDVALADRALQSGYSSVEFRPRSRGNPGHARQGALRRA